MPRYVLRRRETSHEIRQVVTICGSLPCPSPGKKDSITIGSGHLRINHYINKMAEKITIHSVSYSDAIIMEVPNEEYWLFATVVYSGDISRIPAAGVGKSGKLVIELDLNKILS